MNSNTPGTMPVIQSYHTTMPGHDTRALLYLDHGTRNPEPLGNVYTCNRYIPRQLHIIHTLYIYTADYPESKDEYHIQHMTLVTGNAGYPAYT